MSPQILYSMVQQDHAERRRREARERAIHAGHGAEPTTATEPRAGLLARAVRRLPSLAPWSRGSRPA